MYRLQIWFQIPPDYNNIPVTASLFPHQMGNFCRHPLYLLVRVPAGRQPDAAAFFLRRLFFPEQILFQLCQCGRMKTQRFF